MARGAKAEALAYPDARANMAAGPAGAWLKSGKREFGCELGGGSFGYGSHETASLRSGCQGMGRAFSLPR
jgi:hypothetical protein